MAEKQLTTEEILAGLSAVFSPKSKTKKDKRNRILVVNGNIANELISMKQAKKITKQLATTDATVQTYTLEGTLSTDLNVSISEGV